MALFVLNAFFGRTLVVNCFTHLRTASAPCGPRVGERGRHRSAGSVKKALGAELTTSGFGALNSWLLRDDGFAPSGANVDRWFRFGRERSGPPAGRVNPACREVQEGGWTGLAPAHCCDTRCARGIGRERGVRSFALWTRTIVFPSTHRRSRWHTVLPMGGPCRRAPRWALRG